MILEKMIKAEHAVLSASSAKHWRSCIASAVIKDSESDTPNKAAHEGTQLHGVVEKAMRLWKQTGQMIDLSEVQIETFEGERTLLTGEQKDAVEHVTDYIKYVSGGSTDFFIRS